MSGCDEVLNGDAPGQPHAGSSRFDGVVDVAVSSPVAGDGGDEPATRKNGGLAVDGLGVGVVFSTTFSMISCSTMQPPFDGLDSLPDILRISADMSVGVFLRRR